jgi:hypothetical protein
MEVGEYGVGAFLQFVENCNYVLYNQATGREQGEMDIVGIRDADRVVFVCETAFHLRGLQYTPRKAEPGPGASAKAVIDRISKKFRRSSEAISRMFPSYDPCYQFWTMKSRPDINKRWSQMCDQLDLGIEFIHGQEFSQKMRQLREKARKDKSYVDNPFYRTLQILEQATALDD